MGNVKQIDRLVQNNGYDADFYAWALDQPARIRALNVPGLDAGSLAEEIESSGRREKRALFDRFRVLLIHLLKWQLQPEHRGAS